MKRSYLNSYGVEAVAQAFFYLGQFGSVLLPKENKELIRDLKTHLNTFGLGYEEVNFNEYNTGINLTLPPSA